MLKPTTNTLFTFTAALLAAAAVGSANAANASTTANWVGGNANWTTNNWDFTGDSVADTGYPGDGATGNASGVSINNGATVTLSTNLANPVSGNGFTNPFDLSAGMGAGDDNTLNIAGDITSNGYAYFGGYHVMHVNQTAGTFTQNYRFDLASAANSGTAVHSTYDLSGGTLDVTNSALNFGYGNVGNTTAGGNQFTMTVSNTGEFDFNGANMGQTLLHVTGGTVASSGTLDMSAYQGGNTTPVLFVDGSGSTGVSFAGLTVSNTGGSATLQYALDSSGVTSVAVTNDSGLTLGTNSALNVDVSGRQSDGTTGVSLLNYAGSIQGDGSFANVSIADGATMLTQGTIGNLGLDQYALDYANAGHITLYYNTATPEPASLVLIAIGILLLLARRERVRRF